MNEEQFGQAVQELGIQIKQAQLEKLRLYYESLIEENQKTNLTRITEINDVYLKHFYDSLTINKLISMQEETDLCDIGTGAGFPGIVLKIVFPHLRVVLIDSSAKKTRFLQKMIEKLQLNDVKVILMRAEEFSEDNIGKFNLVVARAVGSTSVLAEISAKMIKKDGKLICYRGNISREILNETKIKKVLGLVLQNQITFILPCERSQRGLLLFVKKGQIAPGFPRQYSQIKKNPL